MESLLLNILPILSLALATHAALSPEAYWNSVLPNTQIPKAIQDSLLHGGLDLTEEKSTSVAVGKGGENVNAGKGKPGRTTVNVGKGGVGVNAGKGKPGGTSVHVSKGGVNVQVGKGKPYAHPSSPFFYNYAATETQLHDDTNLTIFFLDKDLKPGKKMYLQYFIKNSETSTFLPQQVAESIPFSSEKIPEILNKLCVKPGSPDADSVKDTIQTCEIPGIKGEKKYCATSLESMINFSTWKLGKNIKAISTEVDKETEMQNYTIKHGVKRMGGEKLVACHKQKYPYAVFYCHVIDPTRAYVVPLEGADGTKVQALAICHLNTSAWNPNHLAFKVLKVKPSTVPVCHFLPQDHVVWVGN